MSRDGNVDWAFAELLAFGTLCMDGRLVRLSGQDSRRGTFVQRHRWSSTARPAPSTTPAQPHRRPGTFLPYDSALSEFAAVGFEYGYSVANPNAFVAWEAQFGDFVNGAQSIIDEFISSGEAKWGQTSTSSSCCRTAWRDRARTTPPGASSGSCSCAPRGR